MTPQREATARRIATWLGIHVADSAAGMIGHGATVGFDHCLLRFGLPTSSKGRQGEVSARYRPMRRFRLYRISHGAIL